MTDPEDAKLVTLARAARARTGATVGAAVRDADGRTYAAASVDLPHLAVDALSLAVAMAASSGGRALEAAAVVRDEPVPEATGRLAFGDLAADGASILLADPAGTVVNTLTGSDD